MRPRFGPRAAGYLHDIGKVTVDTFSSAAACAGVPRDGRPHHHRPP
jgi:hypothetical protein